MYHLKLCRDRQKNPWHIILCTSAHGVPRYILTFMSTKMYFSVCYLQWVVWNNSAHQFCKTLHWYANLRIIALPQTWIYTYIYMYIYAKRVTCTGFVIMPHIWTCETKLIVSIKYDCSLTKYLACVSCNKTFVMTLGMMTFKTAKSFPPSIDFH